MKIKKLILISSITLLSMSHSAIGASLGASSNVGNSASWPSANETYLKQLQAELIKKAEGGFYDGYDYNTNYYSLSYSSSYSVTYDIGSINLDQKHRNSDSDNCGGGQVEEALCQGGNEE